MASLPLNVVYYYNYYNTMNIYNFKGKIKHDGDEEPLRMLVNSLKVNSTIIHIDIGLESVPRGF